MVKLIHIRERCIGCNSCVEHAPNYWRISETDGKSELIGGVRKGETFVREITQIELEPNKKAEEDCPVRIIKIFGE